MLKQTLFFNDNSHLTDEGVALYVDALKLGRAEELPEPVREHVADCQSCRKEITGLFAILADEDYASAGPHPYLDRVKERAKRTRFIYQMAALVAAGIGISLFAYLIYNGQRNISPVATHTSLDSVRTIDSTVHQRSGTGGTGHAAGGDYADRFSESPELEAFVAMEMRSSGIDAVSPGIGKTVSQPVIFNWKSEGSAPLLLTVLTNGDSLVHRGRIARVPYVFRKSLAPGLYYWKLENEEELLFGGKFFVRQ